MIIIAKVNGFNFRIHNNVDTQVEKSDVRPYKILKDLTRTRFFI
jgi:hypothetical protein